MKAAVLTQLNAALEIRDVGLTTLEFGQVLVRLSLSGICGAQLAEIRGEKGNSGHLPHLLGHEGCGIVEHTGAGVTRVKAGGKVVMHWRKAAGIESPLPTYKLGGGYINSGRVTTFNEQAIVSENRLTPVPSDTPDELCALLGCSLSTALATIEDEARLRFGESILIIGVGGLGANLILAARLRQAGMIVATDVHEEKATLANKLGAQFFNGRMHWETARSLRRFDVIVDTSGHPGAIANAIPLLADGGRFVMVGQPQSPVELVAPSHMFGAEGARIIATQGGGFQPHRDIPRYVAMHQAGLLNVDGIVTDSVGLEDINAGLDLVRAGKASRVMVKMG